MARFRWCVFVLLVAVVLSALTGCRRRNPGLTVHFVFEDAKGISVGNKVMGDGVFVGQVVAPPDSPKPRHVVVTVNLNGLSPEKMAYVTTNLTATIKKDSLVAGETYLELVFPDEPGVPLADGAVLKGRGAAGDILDLAGIRMPEDPMQFIEILRAAFITSDPVSAGYTVFYLNWASIVIAILTVVALVLDLLLRLPQGAERERSSPRILREAWVLFCAALVVRFFLSGVRLLGDVGLLAGDLLRALHIGPSPFMDLLKQEWPFWVLVVVLVTVRFKFSLLMRVRKG